MRLLGVTLAFLFAAGPALAHPGHPAGGFASGLAHPVAGLDHLLAMLAVGLWASVAHDRTAWAWPATFTAFTLGGFCFAALGGQIPLAEGLILASVVALGLAVLFRWRAPVALGSALIALFALAHGAAHGVEIPAGAHPAGFAAGLALTTLLLHAAGLAAGRLARRVDRPQLARAAGLGIAVGGLALAFAG